MVHSVHSSWPLEKGHTLSRRTSRQYVLCHQKRKPTSVLTSSSLCTLGDPPLPFATPAHPCYRGLARLCFLSLSLSLIFFPPSSCFFSSSSYPCFSLSQQPADERVYPLSAVHNLGLKQASLLLTVTYLDHFQRQGKIYFYYIFKVCDFHSK